MTYIAGHFAEGQAPPDNYGIRGRFSTGQEVTDGWLNGWVGNFASTGTLGAPVGHFGLHDQ